MKRINIPSVGLVDFPDSMSDEDIAQAIDRDILKLPEQTDSARTVAGTAKDLGIAALKSAVSLPETLVGLVDIANKSTPQAIAKKLITGRQSPSLGKTLDDSGVKFAESKQILDEFKSDAQKQADARVQNAEGIIDTTVEAVKNPSTIVNAGVESLAPMFAGGLIGRSITATVPKVSAVVAGAAGEGLLGAGSAAENTRQQTKTGELTDNQASLAALSGFGTGALSIAGGALAKKLKIADIDTALVDGFSQESKKNFARKVVEGGISEGLFEELPQSVQEQMLSNYSLDKPLFEGVDKAAVMGGLTGGMFGAGAQFIPSKPNIVDQVKEQKQQADNAIQNITNPDISVDEAINLAEVATSTPLVSEMVTDEALLNEVNQATEALPATDILESENVSLPNDTTALATDANAIGVDNGLGSEGNIPSESDLGGISDTAATPTPSIGSDLAVRDESGSADAVSETASAVESTNSLANDSSFVIRDKETGEPVMETFQQSVADKVNTEKYEVVPVLQHLQELNQEGSKARDYAEGKLPAELHATKPTTKPKATRKTSSTLLGTLKGLGGVTMGDKLDVTGQDKAFAPGGYNQVFTNKSKQSLKGHIENGDLDSYLPYDMRTSNITQDSDAYDSTPAYDYLSERIRNGERVLPYETVEEIQQNKFYANDDVQDDIESGSDLFDQDEINALLREAGYDERENISEAQDFEQDKPDSGTVSNERSATRETGSETTAPNEVTGTPRGNASEEIKPLVEAIVKRRAAATQLGKIKQFDTYLALAKKVMNGEQVKATNFKLAANAFKADSKLAETFNQLHELTKAPAKEARAEKLNTVETYKQIIGNAKTVAELQAIARDIQAETVLSDKQAAELDDMAMDAIDKFDVNETPTKEVDDNKPENVSDKKPFELTEKEYEKTEILDNKSVYVKVGNSKVEVVRNPTQSQMREMKNDAISKYGKAENGDPVLRSTQDANGNKYYWKAGDAIHVHIEPSISKEFSVQVNQNAFDGKPSHRYIVRKALYEGEIVPENVLISYPDLIKEVSEIKDNKLNSKYKNTDLLGDNTKGKQDIADAERAKDAKRNTGNSDTEGFTLTGSDSEADKAIAAGAQDLFAEPVKQDKPIDEIIKKAQDDLNDALGDLGSIFGKNFRADITPEQEQKLIPVLTRVFDAAFRLGYYEFKTAAKFVLDTIRSKISPDVADIVTLDQLQGAYISMAGKYGDKATKKRDVVNVESIAEIQETNNVNDERSSTNLERDSENTNTANSVGETAIQTERTRDSGTREPRVSKTQAQSETTGSLSLFDSETVDTRERSNIEIYTGQSPTPRSLARDNDNRGSSDNSLTGTPIEPPATERINEVAENGLFPLTAKTESKAGENLPQELTLENIRQTLPLLKTGQQEDVFKAESKFAEPEGYGMLFTNGTGTGKTFTGLGVIKRFANSGKSNILIVAPNDKIIEDWQNTGKLFNLQLNRLESTTDAGNGIVVTTYANVGANESLADREWDLIVTDEAHYLAMDKDGTNTNALKTVRAITNNPQGKYTRYQMINRVDLARRTFLNEAIQSNIKTMNNDDTMDSVINNLRNQNDKYEAELEVLGKKLETAKKENDDYVESQQGAGRTRALFLSATPFAYEKTIDWANGYLFDYDEGKKQDGASGTGNRGYNAGSNRDQFFMEKFGYRMRYNRLTEPDAKVNRGLMQRQFNTWLKKRGTLSGRMLDVDADYDRKFVLVDSAIGRRIDEALGWFEEQRNNVGEGEKANIERNALRDAEKLISEQFDYLSRRYLLEAIKAKEVIVHVKEHMALGRKVVVFHDYKKGGGFNPFNIFERTRGEDETTSGDTELINSYIRKFRTEFKDLINSPEFKASSPINAFQEAFPNVLLFNGDVPTKVRRANVAKFQDDASGTQVILVQSAAGKEGISLHDTTGKHQRVLFNLGQPTQPTTSIQQEGRIYRTGQVTDAMFRYLNTGTNWERWAFATTIAQRASAAENLALGEQARALKDAFISGFEESDNYRAGMENEGKGGKERDKAANEALTEYDRAKAFYYGTAKKTSKTKAQEGADYFATPEPVGLKMVELADIRPGERVLEPSAGHGAIARWFPEGAEKTAIEPSGNLRPRLAMVFEGSINSGQFEDLNVINKYDAIIMNPPFGSAGRTAVDHVAKAATHLKDGGRIVALIPVGSTDKKFDKWFYEKETRQLKPVTEITINDKNIDIYKGDTIQLNPNSGLGDLKVLKFKDDSIIAKQDGKSFEYMIPTSAVKNVIKTGARTEEYSPAEGLSLVADIKLPSVTFERAGTAVNTRIVVIEKSENAPQQTNRDYTQVTDINDLFDRMETLEIAKRAKPSEEIEETAIEKTEAPAVDASPIESGFKLGEFKHTQTGAMKYVATLDKRVDADEFKRIGTVAKANNGYYSRYNGSGAIPGYLFDNTDDRDTFVNAFNQDGGAVFSRSINNVTTPITNEKLTSSIQGMVDKIREGWKGAPEVIVVYDMNDERISKNVRDENERQLSQGAVGQPEGFYDNGKAYIVASEMQSKEDVLRVLFHEVLGHAGLRGAFGGALKPMLNSIVIGRNKEVLAKAKQYGLKATNQKDLLIAAEEVLAELAQTKPELGLVQRAIAAIRTWLRNNVPYFKNMELSDAEVINNFILPARRFIENNKAKISGSNVAFNRSDAPTLQKLFSALTENEDMFKYGKSDAKDLQQVFDEVVPELVKVEKSSINDDEIDMFYSIYPIDNKGNVKRNQRGQVMVYKDGKVEINVASWDEGFGGSRVYAAVGNWAYNNGFVFAGDRDGITSTGKIRRLENMISLALKFGTTDHIAPHPDQMRDLGFDWKEGDFEYNLGQMLEASYKAIRNGVYVNESRNGMEISYKSPNALGVEKLDDLVYDFDTQQFKELSSGKPFTDEKFGLLAQSREGRATNAGRTTLKRAALAHTFIRAESNSERKRLLELIGKLKLQSLSGTQLDEIFYSRSNPQQSLIPEWESPEASKMDNVIYALQDKNIDLKRVTQKIKQAGNDISDRWNAYLQEELYHGRTATRVKEFLKSSLEPLIEDMRMRGVQMADFEEYLWARHAEERNIQIAKINPDMPDGGSGMKTSEAKAYLAGLTPENKKAYEALATHIDAINKQSRQVLINYGLESADTIAAWEGAYKHYVPLMREDMDAGFGNGTGQGFSVKGNSAKRATGSNRAVVDIIANMAQQFEKNVIRGEKNRVSTALVGLAKLNPNDEFWKVDTPPTIKTVVNGQVETRVDPNYKSRDNVVVARIPDKLGKIQERAVVFNQFDERSVRMAASLKNLDQDQMGELLTSAASITRYFASVNTQYNPIFGVLNIVRDVQGSLLNLSVTPLKDKKTEVLKNIMPALAGIYKDVRSVRKTGKASSTQWASLWEEFQKEGGQTGYRDMFKNAKDRSNAIERALDPEWWTKTKIGKVISINGNLALPESVFFDKAIKPIFDWLSDYNETLENATRLAVYKVAKDNGLSKQQAASLGKNISVNFNRKGEMGRQIGSLYAFFNASVQGTARISETMFTNNDGKVSLSKAGKKILAGGLMLGAAQAVMLAMAGFDDDEPPEFVRDRNIIIPIGNGKYTSIPMPLGFNAIPNFGRITAEWAMSGFTDTSDRMVHILNMLLDVTNPIGNAGLSMQTLAPTVLDPVAALAENKDFTGRPIAQKDFNSLDPSPGFTRAKDTASAISKGISYYLNELTGGTEFKPGALSPTPDQIDYLIGQATGGVGREYMKAEQTATAIATGEDLPSYKIPLLGRFYGDTGGSSAQGGLFYKNIQIMNEHENEIKGRRKANGDVTEYRKENPEASLIPRAKFAYKTVSDLRKRQRELIEKGADKTRIKLINDRITARMTEFNNLVKARQEATSQ
jgi:hypothetical protein